ncbi:hypothetical protein ANTQUA_LOCUS5606 [Anthophora quadrimaculata]
MLAMNYSYNYTEQNTFPPIKHNENTNVSEKRKEWYLLTAGQIIIFLLFALSILLAILLYCKSCTRYESHSLVNPILVKY